MHIIDRRENPRGKSLPNRNLFLGRAKSAIQEKLKEAIQRRSLKESKSGETISIPGRGIREPRLRHSRTGGRRERVFPGNKNFQAGDTIPKPQSGGGSGASPDGDGQDEFQFTLSIEEFYSFFFADLALPDLIKTNLEDSSSHTYRRVGVRKTGTPPTLDLKRTMRKSRARNIALGRPSREEVEKIKGSIRELIERFRTDDLPSDDEISDINAQVEALHGLLRQKERRRRVVPYIDPIDLLYRNFDEQPKPATQAVVFCLMDVSGSMDEHDKDIAKRFFMLLLVFLRRNYKKVDVVFIRHTSEAEEVDEQTFFHDTQTGGTVVSSALIKMKEVIKERYPTADWNIYACQASDGDNVSSDTPECVELLHNDILPLCQFFAYLEILDERQKEVFSSEDTGAELWRGYYTLRSRWKNFAMKRAAMPPDIYPVFRELFEKKSIAHVR